MSLRARISVILLVVAAAAAAIAPASAAPPSVTVSSINGQTVTDGAVARPIGADSLKVRGSAEVPQFTADAGDSQYVKAGEPATVRGSAAFGTAPYAYRWSIEGDSARFADPSSASTSLDTAGLVGQVLVQLVATDDAGLTAVDTVTMFVHVPRTQRLLDETVDAEAAAFGVGGDEADGRPFGFDVPAGTTGLDLELDWGITNDAVVVALRAYDLTVDDPSDVHDGNTDGAAFGKPERIHIDAPTPGVWDAIVTAFLSAPDTYHLTADASVTQPDPTPVLSAGGPYRFTTGQPQVLTASVTGGTAPSPIRWDLDNDGLYDVEAAEVTTSFGLGNHFVTAKTTDAAGYEKRQIVPVLVSEPGTVIETTPFVVVAVSDTGINPYHEDFGAAAFPDASVLAATDNFTKHPSQYINGYPATTPALPITLDAPFAPGKRFPAEDAALFTREAFPMNTLHWIPGTKIIGAFDASDVKPINGAADSTPLLDDDGHGTASASVAVGNLYGYCPTCLLVFGEGFAATEKVYSYPWIDLASNSFGSAANIGYAGLIAPDFPKENAERGQIALYAAGNGNENAFVTPEQTYTSENLGPDWIVRVGAVDRATRQPFLGTGKPVDVSSFGLGTNPSASATSKTGTKDHSGTSAATPYTTGVFGSVLREVRRALGDGAVGAKNDAGEFGVIAKGAPVPGSAYLADGKLTRAELTEVMFKTAQHDVEAASLQVPPTTPYTDLQYVFEGYGIVEQESGARARDVLLTGAPLPERPEEDEFFAADTAVRDFLWGTWNGGGANSSTGSSAAGAGLRVPSTLTPASVGDFGSAFSLLSDTFGPFRAPKVSTATDPGPAAEGGPSVAITDPGGDVTVAADQTPTLPVSGTASFPFGPRPTESVRFYPHREGACATAVRSLTRVDGEDSVCVFATQPAGLVLNASETFPLKGEADPVLDATKPVSGIAYVQGEFSESPVHRIRVDLLSGTTVLGGQTVSGSVLGGATGTPFPFSFSIPAALDGKPIPALALRLRHEIGTGLTDFELDNPASFVDLPFAGGVGFAPDRRVELAVDDPSFRAPRVVDLDAQGNWATAVDLTALPSGTHEVAVRAVADGVASPVASFVATVTRGAVLRAVEVQVVAAGAAADPGAWRAATTRRNLSRWDASIPVAVLPDGDHRVLTRLVVDGRQLAEGAPVRVTLV